MLSQHLPRVGLGREVAAGDLAEGGGLAGAADEHHDGAALRQASFRDGQAPAAPGPLGGDEAGAGLLADQRALRPKGRDVAVVAQAEDAEVEGLGRRALRPSGLVGGRGGGGRELDRPGEDRKSVV